MHTSIDTQDIDLNPLDTVEEILNTNNWVFDRINDDELVLKVTGKSCTYNLFFIWQDDMQALQFCCQYDFNIDQKNFANAAKVLMSINENLWMGHFDIPQETGTPSFRYTCLLRGLHSVSKTEQIEDLVDVSMAQCERHYSIFKLLANYNVANDMDMSLALMATSGEA